MWMKRSLFTVDTSNQYNLIQSKWYMLHMEISFSFAYDKQTIQMDVNDKINCVYSWLGAKCGRKSEK